jgi:hypothetical protein
MKMSDNEFIFIHYHSFSFVKFKVVNDRSSKYIDRRMLIIGPIKVFIKYLSMQHISFYGLVFRCLLMVQLLRIVGNYQKDTEYIRLNRWSQYVYNLNRIIYIFIKITFTVFTNKLIFFLKLPCSF